jgi:diguanylate cyclase (GGDEF)-like protein/PAS domain S-box-containing protein
MESVGGREQPDNDVSDKVLLGAFGVSGEPLMIAREAPGGPVVTWANRSMCEMVRADLSDLWERPVEAVLTSHAGGLPISDLAARSFPAVVTGRDGSLSAWDVTAVPNRTHGTQYWVLMMRPPATSGSAAEKLRASEARFRALADHAPVGIVSSAVGLRLGYVNHHLAEVLGVPVDQILGMGWTQHVVADDLEAVTDQLIEVVSGVERNISCRMCTSSGEQRWVIVRAVPVETPENAAGFVATVEDVTERRAYEETMAWRAAHDPLTGLRNRAGLVEEIDQALDDGDGTAVLFFDLDKFKEINDTLGHEVGDLVLAAVGDRLRTAVRLGDTVYRYAGDEFVVLARGVATQTEADAVARRLQDAVSYPLVADGTTIDIQCSVGVALGVAGADAEELMRGADAYMYEDKRARRGTGGPLR